MESLSPESKALYELMMTDTKEEYERRFLDYKEEVLDAFKPFVADTGAQFKEVRATIDTIKSSVSIDLEASRTQLGDELESVRSSLSSEIVQLAAAIRRLPRLDPGATAGEPSAPHHQERGGGTAGPDGHRCEHEFRGKTCATHMTPPGGGMQLGRNLFSSSDCGFSQQRTPDQISGPPVELPQFDGSNPKLWQ